MAENAMGRRLRDDLPDPYTNPELFDGILLRRSVAFFIDLIIMLALMTFAVIVVGIAGLFTFGLAWLGYTILWPVVLVVYYALTLGSSARATIGMRMMDIVLTPTRTEPLDGWLAALHVFLLWVTVSILTPFVLLVALFTPRRQLLHDLIVGTLMVRKSPMYRHWADVGRRNAGHP